MDSTTSISSAVNSVLKLKSLSPNVKTNDAFTSLVRSIIACKTLKPLQLDRKLIEKIQTLASMAEFELEKYWAHCIINSDKPIETIREFPYYSNYQKLVSRELKLIFDSGFYPESELRILFIGSGPLSLTSIILTELVDATVDNVDISQEAIALGQNVADALGIASAFIHGDGGNISTSSMYDIVFVAALAGVNQIQKQVIIDNLLTKMKKNGRILLRSAIGARELLYPKLSTADLRRVNVLSEYHPTDDVINSVIVCSIQD